MLRPSIAPSNSNHADAGSPLRGNDATGMPAAAVSENHYTANDELPPARGYVTEKLALVFDAMRTVLKRFGVVVQTTDDSKDARCPGNKATTFVGKSGQGYLEHPDKLADNEHAVPINDSIEAAEEELHSPMRSVSEGVEKALHEAGDFVDSKAVQSLHSELDADRYHRRLGT
eukprot:jgi/Chrzof1/329/Cz01g11180.t1